MFCFECCGDHRDLHSFPRRRSSDLPWALFAGWVAGMASGTAMALALGLKSSVYPLHLPAFLGGTYAMYAAVPALLLNLAVSALLAFPFRAVQLAGGNDLPHPPAYLRQTFE